jgi:hypothetical protein
MIPLIPDLCHMRFSQRMLSPRLRNTKHFLILFLLLMTASYASVAAPMQSSENPNAKPAPVPAAQRPPAASTDTTSLQKAVHQKKVITEDDLSKPAKPISLKDLEEEENNPICNLSCEAILREQWRFGSEREAEFRNQLTLARHEITYDRVWNNHLESSLKALGDWCDIQRHKAQILGKGNVASYTRESVNTRFYEREQKLILQHRNEIGLLSQHIGAIQRFAGFRAALMEHEVGEATARGCPEYTIP